jgi:hypothetical protein
MVFVEALTQRVGGIFPGEIGQVIQKGIQPAGPGHA